MGTSSISRPRLARGHSFARADADQGVRLPRNRPPAWHRGAELLIKLLAGSSIAAILMIFFFVTKESLPLFFSDEIRREVLPFDMWRAVSWPGYDEPVHIWAPVSDIPKYGLWPLICGTVKVTCISVAIAAPLGIAAAVYVALYARPGVRELIKPAIELLSGIPSVVLGFLALIVLASALQSALHLDTRLSALLAGVALSIALIPIIFTMTEEALRAVPRTYSEASIALGAARWQTTLFVVLPAAGPGMAAGLALAFGRAVGETMIVLMASGNAAILSANPLDPTRTLSATIAAELAEVVFGGAHYTVLFFIGSLLFAVTFLVNLLGGMVIERMKRRLGGVA